jgi:FkbM family methyltransferase
VAVYAVAAAAARHPEAARLRPASAAGSFLVLNTAAWLAFWVWISGRSERSWNKVVYDVKGSPDAKIAIKGFLKRALARRGFYLGRFPRPDTLSTHLIHLFGKLEINCVLDVGAHEGEFGIALRQMGYRGRIVSYEPVAEHFERLREGARLDGQWIVQRLALGAEAGTARMNVLAGSTFSSILEPNRYGREQFGEKMAVRHVEPVPMARLDSVFEEALRGIEEPRVFLKMDTQGYDLRVIEGAGAALSRVVALQTELSVKPIYQEMSTGLGRMMLALNGHGFELTGLFPVSWDKPDRLRVVELDCVMCRAQNVAAARAVERAPERHEAAGLAHAPCTDRLSS